MRGRRRPLAAHWLRLPPYKAREAECVLRSSRNQISSLSSPRQGWQGQQGPLSISVRLMGLPLAAAPLPRSRDASVSFYQGHSAG